MDIKTTFLCVCSYRELEKVRKEFDRLKENLDPSQIEYESQRKAKSIKLLDAKDNLLKLKALEINRKRKEILMERKELAASYYVTQAPSLSQLAE
jgi:hypothetical protein